MGSKTFMTIGAENHTNEIRQAEDFYSSDPRAASHIFSKMPEFLSADKIINLYWFFRPLFCVYLCIPLFASIDKRKKIGTGVYLLIAGFLSS